MRFEDLEFEGSPEGISRARIKMGKYQLSVIKESHKSSYEVAILNEQDDFVQLPGIHRQPTDEDDWVDDVIPYLQPEQVSAIMLKLASISG